MSDQRPPVHAIAVIDAARHKVIEMRWPGFEQMPERVFEQMVNVGRGDIKVIIRHVGKIGPFRRMIWRLRWIRWLMSEPLPPATHNLLHSAHIDMATHEIMERRWYEREPMLGCPPRVLAMRMAHQIAHTIGGDTIDLTIVS